MNYVYVSHNIRVAGFKGQELGKGELMGQTETREFAKLVMKHIVELEKLTTGRKLIKAINGTTHTCTIFKAGLRTEGQYAGKQTDSVAIAETPGVVSDFNSSVKHFAPLHHILPLGMKGDENVNKQSMNVISSLTKIDSPKQILSKPTGAINYGQKSQVVSQYKTDLSNAQLPTSKSEVASNLTRAINRSHKFRFMIARKVGISTSELEAYEKGTKKIDQETYYRLAFLLYDYLEAGPGVNTQVRFEAVEQLSGEGEEYAPKVNFDHVPGFLVLGHELIHAWRMMAGRRLVRQGYEEEAMTVGIMNFGELDFTENQLRKEAKLAIRPKYSTGVCSSYFMSIAMYHENKSGVAYKKPK